MFAPLSKRLCHMFPVDHGIGVLDQTIDQHRDRQISPLLGRRQINPGIELRTKPFPLTYLIFAQISDILPG